MEDDSQSQEVGVFKSGFAGVIGRPNAGKSTLLNKLVKSKIAIISDKPQTTRHKIRCIVNTKNAQVVFIDTPGFHKPKDSLGEHLNALVRSTLREVDVIVFLVDASQAIGKGDCYIAQELEKIGTPIILVLNKIDKVDQLYLEAQKEVGKHLGDYKDILATSGMTGKGMEELIDRLVLLLPKGPKYYPENMLTDQPEKVIISELIREKAIEVTHEEIPYSIAVEVEEVKARENKDLIDVFASLFVERDSQKGIIIGKHGKRLKEIGTNARIDIQKLLGSQVNLDLRVKVKKDWRKDNREVQKLGYE